MEGYAAGGVSLHVIKRTRFLSPFLFHFVYDLINNKLIKIKLFNILFEYIQDGNGRCSLLLSALPLPVGNGRFRSPEEHLVFWKIL